MGKQEWHKEIREVHRIDRYRFTRSYIYLYDVPPLSPCVLPVCPSWFHIIPFSLWFLLIPICCVWPCHLYLPSFLSFLLTPSMMILPIFDIFLCRVTISPFHISDFCTLYPLYHVHPFHSIWIQFPNRCYYLSYPCSCRIPTEIFISLMGPHFHHVTKYRLFGPYCLLGW